MPDLLSLLLPLLFLLGVYRLLVPGRPAAFRPESANARMRSASGPLAAIWLALVAANWALLDLAGRGWPLLTPGTVLTLLLAALVGLVVAQRSTLLVLTVAGLLGQFQEIVDDHGTAVAAPLVVVTGLLTWLFGAVRGFVAPAPGAGRRVVMGAALVLVLHAVLSTASGSGGAQDLRSPSGATR